MRFIAIIIVALALTLPLLGDQITWIAQNPDNDLENPANWNTGTVPTGSDFAIFSSEILNISTHPLEQTAPFSVFNFHFAQKASVFAFTFKNQPLTFFGTGITGRETNTTINVLNTNNSGSIADQVLFNGANSTSGSAVINISNFADQPGNGMVGRQFHSAGTLLIKKSGSLNVLNDGWESDSGLGGNFAAVVSTIQMLFEDNVTAQDNLTLSVINKGAYTGSNSFAGNLVGIVQEHQFNALGAFQAGNNLSFKVENSGLNSSTGIGNNIVGNVRTNSQVQLNGPFTVGDDAEISISNRGSTSGDGMLTNYIGYIVEHQFHAMDSFQAGDHLNFTATNIGFDNSTGTGGHLVAVVDSFSGFNGNQIEIDGLCTVGNYASISAENNGAYEGTNTGRGSIIASLNQGQILFKDDFKALDYLNVTASNKGVDSAIGIGNDVVGAASNYQIGFNASCILGDYASINASNSGNCSGQNSTIYNNVGSVASNQFFCRENLQAGNFFNLNVENEGIDSSIGVGTSFIGIVLGASQVELNGKCTLQDNANIEISNKGISTNNALSSGNVGSVINGNQFHAGGDFRAGKNFKLKLQNIGFDNSTGAGNQCRVASIGNHSIRFENGCELGDKAAITAFNSGTYTGTNTVIGNIVGNLDCQLYFGGEFTAGNKFKLNAVNTGLDTSQGVGNDFVGSINNQVQFSGSSTFGDHAEITAASRGAYSGNNASGANLVGVINNQQFSCLGTLTAGNKFNLGISNIGDCNTAGLSNLIGYLGISQFNLADGCNLGDDAAVLIENSGKNYGTGTLNAVGCVNGTQALISGDFTAGSNLRMEVSNKALNLGDINNTVGNINGSQLEFQNALTIGNGSLVSVFNNGSVVNSQIVLRQGFDIPSGKATIQALNEGSVGEFGITVLGSSLGGNANIILENNSLNVDTVFPSFTIGELNGNNASIVQSKPALIINNDASAMGDFAGVIQDFPSMVSTLVKQGAGTQKLSGNNTYTGITTIEEGCLLLTGGIAGDVAINPLGLLKGTGLIGGNVINSGNISPGQSIGTLAIFGNFTNNGGNYAVEVNGLGESDLITINGRAELSGGTVVVSSNDGFYQFQKPYTILTASNVTGRYSKVIGDLSLLAPRLIYDPDRIDLIFQTAILNAAKTSNQKAVALRLDGIADPDVDQTIFLNEMVNLSLPEAAEALDSLSGFQHTEDVWTLQILSRQFIRRLYDPLRPIITADCMCCCDPCGSSPCDWTGWLEADGGAARLKGDQNAHGLKMNNYEITGGAQKTFCHYLTAGIAGSYENNRIHYKHGGTGKNNTWFAGLYGLYRPSCYYGLVDFAYGYSSNKINRFIKVGSLNYTARSKPKTTQFDFYGELGVDYSAACFLIQPFAGVEYDKYWRHHVTEKEKHGWGLTIKKKDWSATSSRLGVHLTTCSLCEDIEVSMDLAWNRLLSCRKSKIKGRFNEFGSDYTIRGIDIDRDSVDYAMTISKGFLNCLSTYLEFAGESWKRAHTYSILGGIELAW